MRLLSATIENYRVHRHTTVEFAPGLTLVVAPNESGKSTLVEALHRGLFMPYRKGGHVLDSMRSRDGGNPTIEIRFEADGMTWRVRKVFRGQQSTCTLDCESPARQWANDEAEVTLSALLAGSASADARFDQRWDYLWVTQGSASLDPLRTTGSKELFAALDAGESTEILTLRPDDLALIEDLQKEVDATWGARGSVLSGSELGRLESELAATAQEAEQALSRRAERIDRVDVLRSSRATVVRVEPEVIARRSSLKELESRLEEARRDAQRLATEQQNAEGAASALAEYDDEVQRLEAARREVMTLGTDLGRQEASQQTAAREASDVLEELSGLVEAATRARAQQQALADQAELSEARAHEQHLSVELERLERLKAKRTKLAEQLDQKRTSFEKLPPITSRDLNRIRKLESELHAQRASVTAMAATIKWTTGSGPVRVDGRSLKQGKSHIIDDVTKLQVGTNDLLIGPGGGQDLIGSRQELVELERRLKDTLGEFGVTSTDDAAELLTNRDQAKQKVLNLESNLEALEDPTEPMSVGRSALAKVQLRIESLHSAGIAVPAGSSPDTLRMEANAAKNTAKQLATLESKARALHVGRAALEQQAAQSLQVVSRTLEHARGKLTELELRLGDERSRDRRREALAAVAAATAANVMTLEEALTENSPDILERRLDLLKRSLAKLEEDLAGARASAALLVQQLGSTLDRDLEADVEQSQARVERLKREADAARDRAQGARLLLDTLCSLRDEAREHREAPYLEAMSRYLASLFPNARAGLELDGDQRTLGVIDRARAGLGTFPFEVLSQGARELVGAAARLAMAEVIAAQRQDRCLPVVFDDAFASVDPERLEQLGLVLDQARQQGLQVIMLSCNDRDCGNLGEDALIRLQRPRHAAVSGLDSAPRNAEAVPVTEEEVVVAPSARTPSAPVLVHTSAPADEEEFLTLVPHNGDEISTRTLRTALGWETARFGLVRDALLARGLIDQPEGSRSVRRPT